MKKKNHGFTLLEMTIAVAIVGVTAASSFGAYRYYIPKAQFSESLKMMEAEAPNVLTANRISACTTTGADQEIKGKYGILTVSGAYKKVSGQTCPTDCTLSYKFNDSDVSPDLVGKIVKADVTAGGHLSKSTTGTTVPVKYIPDGFQAISVASGDNCTALNDGSLSVTTGNLTGSDKSTTATPPPDVITPTDPSGEITPPVNEFDVVKKFPLLATMVVSDNNQGGTSTATIDVKDRSKPAYSEIGNWKVVANGSRLSLDGKNTSAYKIMMKGTSSIQTESDGITICTEGSGCGTGTRYFVIYQYYYKDVLVLSRKIARYPEASEGAGGVMGDILNTTW